jgi:hypothetical protein
MNTEKIEQVLTLLSYNEESNSDILISSFECLGVTVQQKSSVIKPKSDKTKTDKYSLLASLFHYSSFRLTEVIKRLEFIHWTQNQLETNKESDLNKWSMFAALLIKDFHIDISSLLDSLSPVIIEAVLGLKKKDQKKYPGFADISKDTSRTYRSKLPKEFVGIIDSCDSWWPYVKKTRDILAHRDHLKVVFGKPSDGILFQVYSTDLRIALLADPSIMWSQGKNVVNFVLYSAHIISEIILFLEQLGAALTIQLGHSSSQLTKCYRDFGSFNLSTILKNHIESKDSD